MYFVRFVKLTNLFKTQTVNALNWELGSKPGIIFNPWYHQGKCNKFKRLKRMNLFRKGFFYKD